MDCNSQSDATGIRNLNAQEESGIEHVTIHNCPAIGLDVEGTNAQNSGPYADVEVLYANLIASTTASVCANFNSVPALRGLHGMTCNSSGSATQPVNGILIDSTGTFFDIHVEGPVNGINIGSQAGASDTVIANIYGASNITNLISIANSPNVRNLSILGLFSNAGNILVDNLFNQVLTDSDLGFYFIGRGIGPERTRVSSSSNVPPRFQSLIRGTTALGTVAIAAGTCAATVPGRAPGAVQSSIVHWSLGSDPGPALGYASGALQIYAFPASNSVNFRVCNNTAVSITPGVMSVNWDVTP